MTSTIRIALDGAERIAAVAYIESRMRERFECEPPPTHGLVFVAHRENRIVGTLVIEGAKDGGLLSLEERYEFTDDQSPFMFLRPFVVEATRWNAESGSGDTSKLLVLATMETAYQLGKLYMLIEAKPYTIKRLAELDMEFTPIASAHVLLESTRRIVGDAGMKYYESDPPPCLYMAHIPSVLAIHQRIV